MTDKELFEKTEKTFNLKQKNNIVNKVFNEGKFKQTLSEKSRGTSTSPIGSNYGQNTVSAARAAGRGALGAANLAGKGIGVTAKGLGKFGNFLRGVIPGTNTNKRKKAETRKQLAQAKAEDLKTKQLQQQMMFNRDQPKPSQQPNQQPNQQQPKQDFKINDTVLVKTKNNPNALGKVTNLLANQKDKIQVTIKGAPPYAYNIQNVKKYDRVKNEESFEQIVKKYR
jgi:hypothetical protein